MPEAATITSASVIRIYAEGAGFVMVNSNYEADGSLGSQGVSHAHAGGIQIPGGSKSVAKAGTVGRPDLSEYRMPQHLDLQSADWKNVTVSAPNHTEVLTALVRRYDFDRYLRVDTFHGRDRVAVTLLKPLVLPEDEVLDKECGAGLARQAAAGETVVW